MLAIFQALALLVTLHSDARNTGTEMGRAAYVASANAGDTQGAMRDHANGVRWEQFRAGEAAYHAAHDVGRSDSAGYYDSFRASDH